MNLKFLFFFRIHALVHMYLKWLDLGFLLCKVLGSIPPYYLYAHPCFSYEDSGVTALVPILKLFS